MSASHYPMSIYSDEMVDRGGADHSFNDPTVRPPVTQRVLNQAWPFSDSKGAHARGLDDRPAEEQQPVYVRVELEHDGEVVLEGRATRWTDQHSHVMVVVSDPRVPKPGVVWVRFRDTRRREA